MVKLLLNHFPGGEGDPTKVILKNELIPAVTEKLRGVEGVSEVAPEANVGGVIIKNGLSILNVMYDGFKNPKYAPCPLLVNMVMAGKLGVKSGEGFTLGLFRPIVLSLFIDFDGVNGLISAESFLLRSKFIN